VSDEDVMENIRGTRIRNSRLVDTTDRAAKLEDTVSIDFKGSIDDVPFDGGDGENYSLGLGSNSFIPGFEDQIVGMNIGDEKEINVTFPEDYNPDFAGKAAVFKVKLNGIKETILPELDDEFAKDVSEYDTLDEYKKSVYEKLVKERQDTANTTYRQAVLEKLIENLEAEIPDVMVDEQLENIIDDYRHRLEGQGMTLEKYLEYVGMSMQDFANSGRKTAENQVKATLALNKVAELENIEVSDEELEAEYTQMAASYKMEIDKVKAAVRPDQLKGDIRLRKAEQFVADNGTVITEEIVDEDKAETKPDTKKVTSKKKTKTADAE
jgi:trigger factor